MIDTGERSVIPYKPILLAGINDAASVELTSRLFFHGEQETIEDVVAEVKGDARADGYICLNREDGEGDVQLFCLMRALAKWGEAKQIEGNSRRGQDGDEEHACCDRT